MEKIIKNYKEWILFGTGCVTVLLAAFLYLYLGGDLVVCYQDQLDGEVPGYMLHAKYLFTGVNTYPELMNGISENGLFPPSPLWILFYRWMPPVTAYVLSHIFCMMMAYTGMYLCLKKLTDNLYIAVFCAILFAFLPLFPVYGMCQYGQPLLFYAFGLLYAGKHKISAMGIVLLYGLSSSLVLIGYAVLGIAGLYMLWLIWKRRLWIHRWFLAGWLVLLGSYLAVNVNLLFQIFGIGEQRISHKEIIVRNGQNVVDSFLTVFLKGTLHTPTHQIVIVLFSTGTLLVGSVTYRYLNRQMRKIYGLLACGYGFNAACALFYALYQSEPIALWRNHVGGIIKEFQIDRVYWLSVSVWYLLLGMSLYMVWEWICLCKSKSRQICASVAAVCLALTVCASAAIVYYYSDFNKNIHRFLQGKQYGQVTWNDFYAPDIFAQIDAFIGREKSSYRTLSFGLYPAAPLYNGFYCLDGYSNNYDLSYLRQFRKIIEGELEKNTSLRQYYDAWGCRCYVLSAELGTNHFMIAKDSNRFIKELFINVIAAKKMGAEYLFSAVQIPNAQKLGLRLLREKPFETPDSYYVVYLYAL